MLGCTDEQPCWVLGIVDIVRRTVEDSAAGEQLGLWVVVALGLAERVFLQRNRFLSGWWLNSTQLGVDIGLLFGVC